MRVHLCVKPVILVGAVALFATTIRDRVFDSQPTPDSPSRSLTDGDEASAESTSVALDEARRLSLERLEMKLTIAHQLVAGERTLQDSAAHIREIDRLNPGFQHDLFMLHAAHQSVDERYCRCAMGWAASVMCGRDDEPHVVAALESELEFHLKGGTLRLPDAPPAAQ